MTAQRYPLDVNIAAELRDELAHLDDGIDWRITRLAEQAQAAGYHAGYTRGRVDGRHRQQAQHQCSDTGADGVALIAAERRRQITKGWTAEHDDRHPGDQLLQAAMFYADPTASAVEWPWDTMPTRGTRICDLERAGALIAAEIDRLHRAAGQP